MDRERLERLDRERRERDARKTDERANWRKRQSLCGVRYNPIRDKGDGMVMEGFISSRREYKERPKEEEEKIDVHVAMDLKSVCKLDSKERSKWLQSALFLAARGKLKAKEICTIVMDDGFELDVSGKACLEANSHVFKKEQFKLLNSKKCKGGDPKPKDQKSKTRGKSRSNSRRRNRSRSRKRSRSSSRSDSYSRSRSRSRSARPKSRSRKAERRRRSESRERGKKKDKRNDEGRSPRKEKRNEEERSPRRQREEKEPHREDTKSKSKLEVEEKERQRRDKIRKEMEDEDTQSESHHHRKEKSKRSKDNNDREEEKGERSKKKDREEEKEERSRRKGSRKEEETVDKQSVEEWSGKVLSRIEQDSDAGAQASQGERRSKKSRHHDDEDDERSRRKARKEQKEDEVVPKESAPAQESRGKRKAREQEEKVQTTPAATATWPGWTHASVDTQEPGTPPEPEVVENASNGHLQEAFAPLLGGFQEVVDDRVAPVIPPVTRVAFTKSRKPWWQKQVAPGEGSALERG